MFLSLVVINYLDIRGAGFPLAPCETNSPLIVDADAVLSFSFALERLKAIARQSGTDERAAAKYPYKTPSQPGEMTACLTVPSYGRSKVGVSWTCPRKLRGK
jgi:hypothetical protein